MATPQPALGLEMEQDWGVRLSTSEEKSGTAGPTQDVGTAARLQLLKLISPGSDTRTGLGLLWQSRSECSGYARTTQRSGNEEALAVFLCVLFGPASALRGGQHYPHAPAEKGRLGKDKHLVQSPPVGEKILNLRSTSVQGSGGHPL